MARFLNGVRIPDVTVELTPPDVKRHNGYYRLLHAVEVNAPQWCEFEFQLDAWVKRVRYYIQERMGFGARYDIIVASTKIFIRVRPSVKSLKEMQDEWENGSDAGAVSEGTDGQGGVSSGADEAGSRPPMR